jgi:hypothetical protein
MFKLLGLLLLVYVAYAVLRGEVYARAGLGGATIERAARPGYYWTVIVVYIGLAIALLTVF